ncbi:hypothetical protein HPB52_013335 [Rhipicephalus sanguineus]|uniref:Uncharacterized protein n=1 Tax=Rhipicephalus sanguineus TaxID=34632 RepID=A0A9D4QC71_RHISA|nr:hypothetical protein HPB52_013335 [Rhipicephalus sanguineus]
MEVLCAPSVLLLYRCPYDINYNTPPELAPFAPTDLCNVARRALQPWRIHDTCPDENSFQFGHHTPEGSTGVHRRHQRDERRATTPMKEMSFVLRFRNMVAPTKVMNFAHHLLRA